MPGGGQFYCENTGKGILFFVAQTFFLAATILEHQRTEYYSGNPQYRERYLTHLGRRDDFLWLGGACYALSAADAYVSAHFYGFETGNRARLVLFRIEF